MIERVPFWCPEFDGCSETHCAYPGEEDCHEENVPIERCDCQACNIARHEERPL